MLLNNLLKYFKMDIYDDRDLSIEKECRLAEKIEETSYCNNQMIDGIRNYCINPFIIDRPLMQYNNFTYIPFSKQNEAICISHIRLLNDLIRPLKKYTKSTFIPEKIWCDKHPNTLMDYYPSQIRFTPFTKSGRISKYTVCAFISNMTQLYGSHGVQSIFYKQNGDIGKAELYYPKDKDTFFKIQIREKNNNLYVRRIDKAYRAGDSNSPVPYLKTEIQYIVE